MQTIHTTPTNLWLTRMKCMLTRKVGPTIGCQYGMARSGLSRVIRLCVPLFIMRIGDTLHNLEQIQQLDWLSSMLKLIICITPTLI